MKEINLNEVYGDLTVIKESEKKRRSLAGKWYHCKCVCGKSADVSVYKLLSGEKKSCGCLRSRACTARVTTHGLCKHPIYSTWSSMMRRCYTKSQTAYHRYGGRGIIVEKRWHKFINFYNDMSPYWKEKLELDRINNNKGYSRKNCRWVTRTEQVNNTSSNRYITINEKRLSASDWSRKNNISINTIYDRLKNGWDPVDAVTMKPDKGRKYMYDLQL